MTPKTDLIVLPYRIKYFSASQFFRKVQFTGNSTFIVSLPIKWVRDIGLEAGDTLNLTPMTNQTLLISSCVGSFIKDSVRQKMIGLELIEESRNELVF